MLHKIGSFQTLFQVFVIFNFRKNILYDNHR